MQINREKSDSEPQSLGDYMRLLELRDYKRLFLLEENFSHADITSGYWQRCQHVLSMIPQAKGDFPLSETQKSNRELALDVLDHMSRTATRIVVDLFLESCKLPEVEKPYKKEIKEIKRMLGDISTYNFDYSFPLLGELLVEVLGGSAEEHRYFIKMEINHPLTTATRRLLGYPVTKDPSPTMTCHDLHKASKLLSAAQWEDWTLVSRAANIRLERILPLGLGTSPSTVGPNALDELYSMGQLATSFEGKLSIRKSSVEWFIKLLRLYDPQWAEELSYAWKLSPQEQY